MSGGSPDRRLLAAGAAELGLLAVLGWWPGARATPWPALLLWSVAWIAWVATVWAYDGRPGSRRVVWVVGVAARLALLPLIPHFSDDIYRYLWDGWVGLHGVNPYLHAPAAPALEGLRTSWHGLVNHPAVPTIYPPGAQLVFLALAWIGPAVLVFKAAWMLCDLGVAWALQRLDRRRDGPSRALPIYLLCPLVLVEVAWSGHLEPLGLLPMVLALLLLDGPSDDRGGEAGTSRRLGIRGGSGAGLLLGAGAAVKFAPAAALPALLRRRPRAALLAVAVPCLLYLPYLGAGQELLAGLTEYAGRWRFDPGLYRGVEALLGRGTGARLAALLPAAGAAAWAFARRWSVERTLFWVLGAALLFSPTLHPWYLLWILPLAALRRSGPWLLWTGLVFLGYAGLDAYRATGQWPFPPALSLLIHAPFLLWLAGRGVARLRRRRGGGQVT